MEPIDSERACYDKALELVAARPHFRAQLALKLSRRGFDAGEVDTALGRLEEAGFLDDRSSAEQYVANGVERKLYGPQRLRAALVRRGVAQHHVEAALARFFPDREIEFAERAAEAWQRRGGGAPAALARHLQRKGYSSGVIHRQFERAAESHRVRGAETLAGGEEE